MTNHHDAYYIEQVRQGHPDAFAPLVMRYKDRVFTLALKMLKNREEAEETAQDVFVKCYQSLARFEGRSKFSTWLYRIAYHACIDALKRNRQYTVSEDASTFWESWVGEEDNALEQMVTQDRNATLRKAIDNLPTDEQTILMMHYFEELSLKEIATVVNLSLTNVKVKLHRSRKKLYELLENRTLIRAL